MRVADAAHLDNARAPLWLKVIRKPHHDSRAHWVFQEKLNQPISEDSRLLFTSVPFAPSEIEAWWLCFDALQMLDQELADVDAILADSRRKQFAIRGVKGAGQADRLCRWVQTDGWLPVDTRIRVNDVAGLAKKLGGEQLYGNDRLVPMRELIQNASDAIRARSSLQSWSPDRGEITVRVGTDEQGHFIEVEDNGVGMSQMVMTGYLLDFGKSFSSGSEVSVELPGLLASGFEPTGKYGIGFFSVFMQKSTMYKERGRRNTAERVRMSDSPHVGGVAGRVYSLKPNHINPRFFPFPLRGAIARGTQRLARGGLWFSACTDSDNRQSDSRYGTFIL
jgi:hypothetical protein